MNEPETRGGPDAVLCAALAFAAAGAVLVFAAARGRDDPRNDPRYRPPAGNLFFGAPAPGDPATLRYQRIPR